MTTKEENKPQDTEEKNRAIPLPRPIIVESSPLSSPYFRKLPPLSPRSMKMIDPNYNVLEDYRRKSPAELSTQGSSCSAESTTSLASDYLTTSSETVNLFEFQRKPSESLESSSNDIDFFLQVVNAFDSYLADQISVLEAQYSENYKQQQNLQKRKKKIEELTSHQENDLGRDVALLISTIHQKLVELKTILQKQSQNAIKGLREKEGQCRKNMKIISELLSFAKRLRSESGESLKRNMVREFKERLSSVNDLSSPDLNPLSNYPSQIDVTSIKNYLMNIKLQERSEKVNGQNHVSEEKTSGLFIQAPLPDDDISKTRITVRWSPQYTNDMHEVNWKYVVKGKVIEKKATDVTGSSFIINELPSNCDVIVRIGQMDDAAKWSEPAKYKTLETPASFTFDATTAHVKLKLSPDKKMVHYGGEHKSSSKSPSRFSFALNVLGNQAFFSGRHYWEMKVNQDGWACGVAYQGVPRNSWLGSNVQSWILHHNPARLQYKVRHAGEAFEVDADLKEKNDYLKNIGIYLDMEGGFIRFVDPSKERILHTYTVDRFEEAICAAANPFYNGGRLTLLSGLDVPKFLIEF